MKTQWVILDLGTCNTIGIFLRTAIRGSISDFGVQRTMHKAMVRIVHHSDVSS